MTISLPPFRPSLILPTLITLLTKKALLKLIQSGLLINALEMHPFEASIAHYPDHSIICLLEVYLLAVEAIFLLLVLPSTGKAEMLGQIYALFHVFFIEDI